MLRCHGCSSKQKKFYRKNCITGNSSLFCEFKLDIKMSDTEESVSTDVEESAALAVNSLMPAKSKYKYEKAYKLFEDWCQEKRINKINETALLAYFEQKSRVYKGSTLWSLYSMLRTTLSLKKNVDIKKYPSLIVFLKRKSLGQTPKKSNVFTNLL